MHDIVRDGFHGRKRLNLGRAIALEGQDLPWKQQSTTESEVIQR